MVVVKPIMENCIATPMERRLLGPTRRIAPRARGLGVAAAAMGDPGVTARLINHVGNAVTTLLQKSLPWRLCRLLRAAKGSANAIWCALFALMTTSQTSVRFSVVRSFRSPIVLTLMIMEFFSYPDS
jgi:hypothetical protein